MLHSPVPETNNMLNFTSLLALGCALAFTACTSPKGPAQTPAKREMKPDGGVPAANNRPSQRRPPQSSRHLRKRHHSILTPQRRESRVLKPALTAIRTLWRGFCKTGMGNSLYRPNTRIENFDAKAATVTHPKSGLTYRAYIDEAGRWWQEETLPGTDHLRRVDPHYRVWQSHSVVSGQSR